MSAKFAIEAVDNQDSVGQEVIEYSVEESSLLLLTKELLIHHDSELLGEAEEVDCAIARFGHLAGLHRKRRNFVGGVYEKDGEDGMYEEKRLEPMLRGISRRAAAKAMSR
jgi:hypothetical protein